MQWAAFDTTCICGNLASLRCLSEKELRKREGASRNELKRRIADARWALSLCDEAEQRGMIVDDCLKCGLLVIKTTVQQAEEFLHKHPRQVHEVIFSCDASDGWFRQWADELRDWQGVWDCELDKIQRAKKLLDRAEWLRSIGQMLEASAHINDALTQYKLDPALLTFRGRVHLMQNKPEEAREDFLEAKARYAQASVPDSFLLQQFLPLAEGQVHYGKGRSRDALQCLKLALEVMPQEEKDLRDRALDLICALRLETGEVPQSPGNDTFRRCILAVNDNMLEHVDRLLADNPNDVEALMIRGRKLVEFGQPQEAIADFDRALALNGSQNPLSVDVHFQRSFANQKLHDLQAALSDCFAAQDIDGGNDKVRCRIEYLRNLLKGEETVSNSSRLTTNSVTSIRSSQPLLHTAHRIFRGAYEREPSGRRHLAMRSPLPTNRCCEEDDSNDGI